MKRKIVLRDVKNLSIVEAMEQFINFKRAMNKAKDTIDYYKTKFNFFYNFIRDVKGIELTNEINEDCIIEYILYKRENNADISDNTINNHLRAIRATLYYFMEKGYTDSFHIPLISVKQTPKEGYTKEEQQKLIEKPNIKNCSFAEYRNWVLICHLLASGNRSRTIRYIKNKDVNLSEKIIALNEVKNKEGYEMPISDEYFPILKEYMEIRSGEADDYLFCNQFGKQLAASTLKHLLHKYNNERGVKKTSIHIFRNTFAKNWLLEGGSSKKLQHALGHKYSNMVDEYARLYGRELREEFSKYTPLAGLKDIVSENKRMTVKK